MLSVRWPTSRCRCSARPLALQKEDGEELAIHVRVKRGTIVDLQVRLSWCSVRDAGRRNTGVDLVRLLVTLLPFDALSNAIFVEA